MIAYPLLENLAGLIHSLTNPQKRYFRMYVGTAGEQTARYIRLFDAIKSWERSEQETMEAFAAQLIKRGIVRSHEVSQVAGYLYDKILESMRGIPESHRAHADITGYLRDCRFLLDKELFEGCRSMLKRVGELLSKYDYPELELERLLLERHLHTRWGGRQFELRLEEIHNEVESILSRLQQDNELYLHNVHIMQSFYLGQPLPEKTNNAIHRYMIRIQTPELGFGTRYRMTIALANYHRLTPKPQGPIPSPEFVAPSKEMEFRYLEDVLELMLKNPKLRAEEPAAYLQLLVRYLATALDNERWDRFVLFSQRLKPYENTPEFYKSFVYLYLISFLKKGVFEEGEKYIRQHKLRERLFLPNYRMRASRLATILFYCAIICFVLKKGEESLFWLDKVITHNPPESLPDLRCVAQFLKILIIYQTPSLQRIHEPELLIHKLEQWLSERKFEGEFYGCALTMIKHTCIGGMPDHGALENVLVRLKELFPQKKEYEQFGIFLAWFDSRLEGVLIRTSVMQYL